jgi:hypothetical protein
MQNSLQGTFHFHSTYSHDGKSTLGQIASVLKRRGFSFCIMTEHFEDFDAPKLSRYLLEADAVGRSSGFIFVPGIEIHLSGIDTILFPAPSYAAIVRFVATGEDNSDCFKVLAHPTKYSFDSVAQHLARYRIDAVEMWNQQADSSYLPPLRLLEFLRNQPWRDKYHYLFGCDLHSANLKVSNVLHVDTAGRRTAEAILRAMKQAAFASHNLPTGIRYHSGARRPDFDAWADAVASRTYYRGRVLHSIRTQLKSAYKMLPRDMQHSLNDLKNFVRNRV